MISEGAGSSLADEGPLTEAEQHAELARHYQDESGPVDGWSIAQRLSQVGREISDPQLRALARKIAAKAVLRRAARLVGPIRPALRRIYEAYREPFRGELDIDRTLDTALGHATPSHVPDTQRIGRDAVPRVRPSSSGGRALPPYQFPPHSYGFTARPEAWVMTDRREKQPQVVLMMDVSFSMSGRNLALAAVAAAVLALKIRTTDLAVIAFEGTARTLHSLGQSIEREELVESVLSEPARGYTNIEDALKRGHREMRRARSADVAAILITDGNYTQGGDPLPLARKFRNLHVMLTEDHKMNEDLCRRMANAGRGKLFKVTDFDDLPVRMLDIANRVLG